MTYTFRCDETALLFELDLSPNRDNLLEQRCRVCNANVYHPTHMARRVFDAIAFRFRKPEFKGGRCPHTRKRFDNKRDRDAYLDKQEITAYRDT